MKITCFAASSSRESINKKLVTYVASLVADAEVEILDLNDYELPLFSVDREAELGQPPLAQAFLDKISGSDALIIAFAEHNGCYSAAYKNIYDWVSRIQPKVYQDRRMLLLATSPDSAVMSGAAYRCRCLRKTSTSNAARSKTRPSMPRSGQRWRGC